MVNLDSVMFVAVKIERKSYEKWFHIYLISVRYVFVYRIQTRTTQETEEVELKYL